MLEDPPTVGDTVLDTDQAVIINDERVGSSQGFTIGAPMPSGESPVYYWTYTGGAVPTGCLVMTATVASNSGYTAADGLRPYLETAAQAA